MFKNHKAYTLWEILITLVVLTILLALVVPSLFHTGQVNEKKLQGVTSNFYQSVENALVYLRSNDNLHDSDGDNKLTKIDFKDYFMHTLDGEEENPINCDIFKGHLGTAMQKAPVEPEPGSTTPAGTSDIADDLVCGQFGMDVTAGFYFEPKCNLTVVAKEYYIKTPDGETATPARTITNACGFIVYATRDSMKHIGSDEAAVVGENIFTIATGDAYVK